MTEDSTPLTAKEAEEKVDQILATAGVIFCARYFRETIREHDWKCDQWSIVFTDGARLLGEFDFYTGIGQRKPDDSPMAKLSAHSLAKVSKRTLAWEQHFKNYPDRPVAPHPAAVIHSILSESSAAEETFASWCDNFGYDTDSRKALATYETCQNNWDKFRKVFTPSQIQELREALENY